MSARRMLAGIAAMLVLVALPIVPCAAQPAPHAVLAGKTVTIVIGVQAGGTSDIFIRTLAPYIKKHTPGQPNFLVQFMPGAGGILATNYLYEVARPDGLTIGFGPWDPLAQALGNQGLRARYDRFEVVAGIGDTRIVYARSDVIPGGLQRPADIAKASFLNIGSFSSTDWSGLMAHLALDTLGVRHKVITGYRGGNDILLAAQRGEVQFHSTSIGTLRTRGGGSLKDGTLKEIGYVIAVGPDGTFQPNPAITEMPPFPEVVREALGKPGSGPSWDAMNWLATLLGQMAFVALCPPGTSQPALAELRQGFAAALDDPDFVRQSIAVNGMPYVNVKPEHAQAIFKALSSVTPEVLATLRAAVDALGR